MENKNKDKVLNLLAEITEIGGVNMDEDIENIVSIATESFMDTIKTMEKRDGKLTIRKDFIEMVLALTLIMYKEKINSKKSFLSRMFS